MGNSNPRYVDVDELKNALMGVYAGGINTYSSSLLEQHLLQTINTSLQQALENFKYQMVEAIERSAKPYSQCMLCVRKDHDIVPPHPLGGNR